MARPGLEPGTLRFSGRRGRSGEPREAAADSPIAGRPRRTPMPMVSGGCRWVRDVEPAPRPLDFAADGAGASARAGLDRADNLFRGVVEAFYGCSLGAAGDPKAPWRTRTPDQSGWARAVRCGWPGASASETPSLRRVVWVTRSKSGCNSCRRGSLEATMRGSSRRAASALRRASRSGRSGPGGSVAGSDRCDRWLDGPASTRSSGRCSRTGDGEGLCPGGRRCARAGSTSCTARAPQGLRPVDAARVAATSAPANRYQSRGSRPEVTQADTSRRARDRDLQFCRDRQRTRVLFPTIPTGTSRSQPCKAGCSVRGRPSP
jgi:hypothetical protein